MVFALQRVSKGDMRRGGGGDYSAPFLFVSLTSVFSFSDSDMHTVRFKLLFAR